MRDAREVVDEIAYYARSRSIDAETGKKQCLMAIDADRRAAKVHVLEKVATFADECENFSDLYSYIQELRSELEKVGGG